MSDYRMYIDGAWCEAAAGASFDAINPARGEPFGTVASGTRADAQRAIEAANAALPGWSRTPLWERADLCLRMATVLEQRADELADILTTELGKPRQTEAAIEAAAFVPLFYRQAGELARYQEGSTFLARDPHKRLTTFRRPRGVVAVITPWNFPAMIPSEYLPYAIVMGNTVCWTPAPTAAATAAKLMECLLEAGLPKGVINLVIGPGDQVGDELVTNPGTHAIAMTGSTATGRIISARAGLKPRLLELGGNGPAIVLSDADPTQAAAKMSAHVADAKQRGAQVLVGGKQPDLPGYFYEPTVLVDFDRDSLVNIEETFGPIAPVRAVASDDETWDFIEACDLGLVSSVFTADLDRAWQWAERLRTGVVVINDNSNFWEPHVPFGGMSGSSSGVGRLGGRHVLEFMSDLQTVAFHIG